jgi:hypothetical protein
MADRHGISEQKNKCKNEDYGCKKILNAELGTLPAGVVVDAAAQKPQVLLKKTYPGGNQK